MMSDCLMHYACHVLLIACILYLSVDNFSHKACSSIYIAEYILEHYAHIVLFYSTPLVLTRVLACQMTLSCTTAL